MSGLFFIGEAVDVTGHLGGFNFQWAWASAVAAGQRSSDQTTAAVSPVRRIAAQEEAPALSSVASARSRCAPGQIHAAAVPPAAIDFLRPEKRSVLDPAIVATR